MQGQHLLHLSRSSSPDYFLRIWTKKHTSIWLNTTRPTIKSNGNIWHLTTRVVKLHVSFDLYTVWISLQYVLWIKTEGHLYQNLFFFLAFSPLLLLFLALWRITDKLHFCFVKYIDSAVWLQISVRIRLVLLPMRILNNNLQLAKWHDEEITVQILLHYGAGWWWDVTRGLDVTSSDMTIQSYSILQHKLTNFWDC